MFTETVEVVSDTSIYARAAGRRQTLVYELTYAAKNELAMVLPLPVPPGTPEEGVEFISLAGCADFFGQMRDGFPRQYGFEQVLSVDARPVGLEPTLKVVDVGQYEASFVPRPEDFARLDERFRLPVDLWLQLNTYRDWGFAVFKLKASRRELRVHPMAFSFPRRDLVRLYFPTLHIHHRALEATAEFDHQLYCQPEPAMNWHLQNWRESSGPASEFIRCKDGLALLDAGFPVWNLELSGKLDNADTWLGRGGRIPARPRK